MTVFAFVRSRSLFLLFVIAAQSAYADPTTPLGKWFCTSLRSFDSNAAFNSFPLQKLGKPEEVREKTGDRVSVSIRAANLDLDVEYSYQFKEEDVDSKYGFRLKVVDKTGHILDERQAMSWLMEFGKPQRIFMGWQVAIGKEGVLPAFSFGMSDSPYITTEASWFRDADIARAGPVCDAAKAPVANTPLPNVMDRGPAVDPKKDRLSRWFCSVLRKDFDFSNAVATFPLESLPHDVERRNVDDGVVTISRESKGNNYNVAYRYSYKMVDVHNQYGFGLYVTNAGMTGPSDYEEGMKWLRGFGKPKKDMIGYSVAAAPPAIEGLLSPFFFALWNSSDVRSAHWFSESDIVLAKKLCPQ